MSRTYRKHPTYDKTKKKPDPESNHRDVRHALNKTYVKDVTRLAYAEYEDLNTGNKARKFRRNLKGKKDNYENKESYSHLEFDNKESYFLEELMDMKYFQSLQPFKNIKGFRKALTSFLYKRYSKYITHITLDHGSKRNKIYKLIELLRKENPTISSTKLDFLKSLIDEKETDLEK